MKYQELEGLRYPIGEFLKPEIITPQQIEEWINIIANFPEKITALTHNLTLEQLSWTYRPVGWSIKQVVHHCADSHMNSFIRFKLALTEEAPTIRPYNETSWATLSDGKEDDLEDSLLLIKSLHNKWVRLLRNLSSQDLKRTFIHPEHGQRFELDENIGIYAWHCRHHLEHIKIALMNEGRFNP